MNGDVIINVDHVSKVFKLPHEKQSSIKSALINVVRGGNRSFEEQKVLDDISLQIRKGDFFGIVGRNGSGKSTLLKLLAGIYHPTTGGIGVTGKLTPFIELGVGFNPELTGRENVFLNGALLGFSRKEMETKYKDIVKFAELERFMDQKLKNYSSGMQVRLAFSIAIRAESDILLIDEVLAVGDAAFQQKCFDYFEKLKREKRTIVIVTHDMGAVKRFCNRAALIEYGVLKQVGTPDEVADQYTLDNINAEGTSIGEHGKLDELAATLNIIPTSEQKLTSDQTLTFDIEYELHKSVPIDFGISILHQGMSLVEQNTQEVPKIPHEKSKKYRLSYSLPLKSINPGNYRVDVAIFEKKGFKLAGFNTDAYNFMIAQDAKPRGGVINTSGTWHDAKIVKL